MRNFGIALLFALSIQMASAASATRMVRYPHVHEGRIVFSYLGDIWTADDKGRSPRRLTVHIGRDVFPRFSPDGKWIAYSSERYGNLDVFIMPSEGGPARQLTFHSADDTVLGWTPNSSSVLFASQRRDGFAGKLYVVGIDGNMERDAGSDMGVWGSFSPDGKHLAINRKAQVYWRKHYRGINQSDIAIMDVAKKQFTNLTDFAGQDSWPMWGTDGFIYFVSDRDSKDVSNLWRISEKGGKAEQLTKFGSGEVRWPSISADGKVIVFEHEFEVWKFDVKKSDAEAIHMEIAAETQENMSEVRDFRSQLDSYDLRPSGGRIVLSVHGEIFTAPVKEGDLRRLTEGPARDREPEYSPDGKSIAYVSDSSGREEIYVVATDGEVKPVKVTNSDTLKFSFAWSPDSKVLVYSTSENILQRVDVATQKTTKLASSKFGSIGLPVWSPDGKWIAYVKRDHSDRSRIYLVSSEGGDEHLASTEAFSDRLPLFTSDGRKLYFIRGEGVTGIGEPAPPQIWSIGLERLERDPKDPKEDAAEEKKEEPKPETEPSQDKKESDAESTPEQAPRRAARRGQNPTPREIKMDFAGFERRTEQLTRMPYGVTNCALAPGGKSVVFLTREPAGDGSATVPALYSIKEDGKELTRVYSGAREGESNEENPAAAQGISTMKFTPDGRTLFFREGRGVYSIRLPAEGAAAAPARNATREQVRFTAPVRIDSTKQWEEMFDDAWRTMKYRFYDAGMHGMDWEGMRNRYGALVQSIGDREELMNIINEMIGELNASHTGAAAAAERQEGAVSTRHLGLDLEPDEKSGRYRVAYIYKKGPADKDWVKVKKGDYLIAIEGEEIKANDNLWKFLNHRLNRKIDVKFNEAPKSDGAWTTRIEPISMADYAQLRYERWVEERRKKTDELSGGRVGYIHIQAMNPPSLRKFQRELLEYQEKEALIIDERWNGGGNIEQELLSILGQRPYQVWRPRDREAALRPLNGYYGPKVVLQNHRSASNAEMFPAGFRALGLGKVIGTPTTGAVIGTGSYRLIDGSTVRTPGVGVFLYDDKRTNMENYGVPPDIFVDNSPEDNLADLDRQLEAGVTELMKEIGPGKKGTK